ncbi:MAG: hypothetical protein AABZ11_09010 [Nitrospinota bacterium]|mgnify:CR=1 FL=1
MNLKRLFKKEQSIAFFPHILLVATLIFTLSSVFKGAVFPAHAQEEGKGFLSEIEEAVKEESRQVKEILDRQTDKASRNLLVIAGAIIIPVSLILIVWISKLILNIIFSIISSFLNISRAKIALILKRDAISKREYNITKGENRPRRKPLRLGEILASFVSRSLTMEQIHLALLEQKKEQSKPLIGELLVRHGFATPEEVKAALKIQGKKG